MSDKFWYYGSHVIVGVAIVLFVVGAAIAIFSTSTADRSAGVVIIIGMGVALYALLPPLLEARSVWKHYRS